MATAQNIVFNTEEIEGILNELTSLRNEFVAIGPRTEKACKKIRKQGSGTWSLEVSVRALTEDVRAELNGAIFTLQLSKRMYITIDEALKRKAEEITDVEGIPSSRVESSGQSNNINVGNGTTSGTAAVQDYRTNMRVSVNRGIQLDGHVGGADFGKPNSNWCDAFSKYILDDAGVKDVPYNLQGQEAMFANYTHVNDGYSPKTGDLVFFDWNHNGTYDHVGVIVIDEATGNTYVLHGNYHTSHYEGWAPGQGGEVSYDTLSNVVEWGGNASYKIADVESYVADHS